jgi:hypothetical protein
VRWGEQQKKPWIVVPDEDEDIRDIDETEEGPRK